MAISVRPAHRDDVASLAQIHLATVTVAYAGLFPADARQPTLESLAQDWWEAFDDSSVTAFIALNGTQPVGTVAVRSDPDFDGCGQLRRLHVLPALWQTGIGSALHDAAVTAIRDGSFDRAGLWVLEDNVRARRFYEGKGWTRAACFAFEGPAREVRYRLPIR